MWQNDVSLRRFREQFLLLCLGLAAIFWFTGHTRSQSPESRLRSTGKMRIGVWIYDLASTEGGDVERIVSRAKTHGLSYIVVRTYHLIKGQPCWAPGCPSVKLLNLVESAHRNGILVYGWAYSYPNRIEAQTLLTKETLRICDGFVFNAESPFLGAYAYDKVDQLCGPIRNYRDQNWPNKLLACSTAARADSRYWGRFPYVKFNRYCDMLWVQTYHKTFRWHPDDAVREINRIFADKYSRWSLSNTLKDAIRPIVHTAQAYAKNKRVRDGGRIEYIPASEFSSFLQTSLDTKHYEANVWRWDLMDEEHWKVIAQFTGASSAPTTSTSNM